MLEYLLVHPWPQAWLHIFFFLKKKKKQKKIKLRKDMDENLRDHEMDFVFINCAQVSS